MYVYQADTYCDSCGEAIRAQLLASGDAPADPDDEWSYDSDDFPKGPCGEESTDGPDHCASYGDCLEGVNLGDYGLAIEAPLYGAESRVIGALLSDGLTDHGAEDLRSMLNDREPDTDPTPYKVALHAYWREVFADELGEVIA
jgi:hypothetical protein